LCFFCFFPPPKKERKKRGRKEEEESRYLVLVYGEAQIVDLGALLCYKTFIFSLAKGMW
jgi:hypothetical protein